MGTKQNENIKDIAKERTFANQTEQYNKEFAKWRADENNPYGYKYVHDEREHSYVVDEGYLKAETDVAERMALFKCLSLLGVSLLVMLLICFFREYFFKIFFPGFSSGKIYFNNRSGLNDSLTWDAAAALCLFDCGKFLVPALLFATVSKIPKRVALPLKKTPISVFASSLSIMMVTVVVAKLCQYAINYIFGAFGVDSLYLLMYTGESPGVDIVSFMTHCVFLPISMEIFFRGVILQTFRQFGDGFAIVVSSVAGAFVCYDFSYIGYCALVSFMLSFFTIKTGSIKVSVLMSVLGSTLNYLLSLMRLYGNDNSLMIELAICALIVGLALVGYSKLTARSDWNFDLGGDNTEMSFGQKMKIFFTTDTVMIWFVAGFIFILNSYRGSL